MCKTIQQASNFTDECDRAGDLPRCQLCPGSPTYWKTNAAAPAADPWNGLRTGPAAEPSPLVDHGVVLEWGTNAKPDQKPITGKPKPCAICGHETTIVTAPSARYPRGRSIHKACAERVLTEQRDKA